MSKEANIHGYLYVYKQLCVCVGVREEASKNRMEMPDRETLEALRTAKASPKQYKFVQCNSGFLGPKTRPPNLEPAVCLPQRARSCFWNQIWPHFWGPNACLQVIFSLLDIDIRTRRRSGSMARYYRSKGRAKAQCWGGACNTWSHATVHIYIHTNPHTSIGNTTPILWSGEPCGHLKQLQRFPRSTFSSDVLELWSFWHARKVSWHHWKSHLEIWESISG